MEYIRGVKVQLTDICSKLPYLRVESSSRNYRLRAACVPALFVHFYSLLEGQDRIGWDALTAGT